LLAPLVPSRAQGPGRQVFSGRRLLAAAILTALFLAPADLLALDVSGTINTDTTWRLADSPIVVTGNVAVTNGALLTVEPGVVVLFNPAVSMSVTNAFLSAQGTPANPIYFTSSQDSSVGGSGTPAAGNWQAFTLSAASATFANVTMRYGGFYSDAMFYVVSGSTLNYYGGELAYSTYRGIWAREASVVSVSSVSFHDCQYWALASEGSLVPVMAGNTFSGPNGAQIDRAQIVQASGNTFQNISTLAMQIDPGVTLQGFDSTIVGQAGPGALMAVELGPATVDSPAAWAGAAMPYVMTFGGWINFSPGAALTLTPGTVVKMQNAGMSLRGGMTALGTEQQPIVLTSFKDDSIGGDTNGDGSASSPSPGDWPFLQLVSSSATLSNVKLRYGSDSRVLSPILYVDNGSTLTFTGGEVAFSAVRGIYAQNDSRVWISSVSFHDNQSWGLDTLNSLVPVMTANTFSGAYGARIDTPQTVQASGNTFQNISDTALQVHPGVVLQGFESTVVGPMSPGGLMGVDLLPPAWGAPVDAPTTWVGSALPYVMRNGQITFSPGASLTLTPGAVVKNSGWSPLITQGGLSAIGTPEHPIVFTSLKDDAAAGDTNGDGSATAPAAGDWSHVQVYASSATFANARFRYGGAGGGWNASQLSVIDGSTATLAGGEMSHAVSIGVYGQNMAVLRVSGVDFSANGSWGIYSYNAQVPELSNNVFSNTASGAYIDTAQTVQAAGNTFQNISGIAMQVAPGVTLRDFGTAVAGSASPGGLMGVDLLAGTVYSSATWEGGSMPFVMRSGNVNFSADASLTLAPGTVVKLLSAGLWLEGGLSAEGAVASPVIFTSLKDDDAGGDTNGDANGTTPASGDWSSVTLWGGRSTATLSHVKVKYGGSSGPMLVSQGGAALLFSGGEVSLSASAGIAVDSAGSLSLSSVTVSSNTTGIITQASRPAEIHQCSIAGNNVAGLNNQDAGAAQAQYNWWGAASGPTTEANPGGTGDAIVGNVAFAPFLQAPPQAPPVVVGLLDPSPTQSKTVHFQLSFSQNMDTGIQPTLTYGLSSPYNSYQAGSGSFTNPLVWTEEAVIPAGAPDGSYSLQVADARTQSGQTLAASTHAFYAVDNTAPQVAIASPADGITVSRPIIVSATADDANGVAQAVFSVDGVALATATAVPYTFSWDSRGFAQGWRSLSVQASDSVGNVGQQTITVMHSYAPPPAPAITEPTNGFVTDIATITISGTAEVGASVMVMSNNLDLATAAVNSEGLWSVTAALPAEDNITLTAVAFEPQGFSQPSPAVTGVYSTAPPNPPESPIASPGPAGRILLSWSLPSTGKTPASYRIYRSTTDTDLVPDGPIPPFRLLLANNVTATSFTDSPSEDGLYFYGVTSLDGALHESILPDTIVYGLTDRTPPSAQVLISTPTPLPAGTHEPRFELSEVLAQPPIFTFTPPGDGAQPMPLNLTPITATLWQSTITLTSDMGQGMAQFAFQGRDIAGNIGLVVTPASLPIDTRGPAGTVALSEASPMSTGALTVTLSLDEPSSSTPTLSVTPQGKAGLLVALAAAEPFDNKTWTGVLDIDAATGEGQAAISYSGSDALGNTSTVLSGGATYFVIDTVAPNAPEAVNAHSLPEAGVLVSWSAPCNWSPPDLCEHPVYYNVYRDGMMVSSGVLPSPADGSASYTETAPEGPHNYEVSCVDLAGNESAPTDPTVYAKAIPPAAPIEVAASFKPDGQIEVDWAPGSTDSWRYNVFRTTYQLTSTSGVIPRSRNALPPLLDWPNYDAIYHYSVTALDVMGNESILSDEATITWDKGYPNVSISGVGEGAYYRTDVAPTYEIVDLVLDPGSVRAVLDGQNFVSGSPVSAEGRHTLTVSAANTGGHYSTATANFTIDKTAPQISYSLAEGAAVTSTVPISVQVTVADLNPGTSAFTLVNHLLGTTVTYQSGGAITRNGSYELRATATDLAGNSSTTTLSFSFEIGPVAPSNLTVTVNDTAQLSWSAPEPGLKGYRVYRDGVRLSGSKHEGTAFEYAHDASANHVYEVSAVDAAYVEGPKARATVPAAVLGLAPLTLTRGFFNALRPTVQNNSGSSMNVGPASLQVLSSSGVAASANADAISIGSGETGILEGVVATPVGLPSPATVRASVALPTDPGAAVFLAKDFTISVMDPQEPIIEVFPGTLVPGTMSPVQVRLYNRGSAAMDVITAQIQNSTYAPVNDVSVQLRTTEGTLFASGGLLQIGNGANGAMLTGRQVFFVSIPAGQSVLLDPVRVLVPNTVVDSLNVVASVSTPTYSLGWANLAGTRGFTSTVAQGVVGQVPYQVAVAADKSFYDQGEAVTLSGQAVDNNGYVVPEASVTVHVNSNGFERTVSTVTDASGNYSVALYAMPNEAGSYSVFAGAPAVVSRSVQSSFTIVGFGFEYSTFTATLAQNSSVKFTVGLKNTGATAISGLATSIQTLSGSGLTLSLDQSTLPQSLAAGAQANLSLSLAATSSASSGTHNLVVSEAHGFARTLPVVAVVMPAQAIGVASPQAFEMGIRSGQTRTQVVTLENKGFETWQGVRLSTPTLEWVQVLGETSLGDIPPGGNANFTLSFSPASTVPNSTYVQNPLVRVISLNLDDIPINAGIAVTSSQEGRLNFSVINADKPRDANGDGFAVSGATATLTSLDVPGLVYTAAGDANGLVRFGSIPAGKFAWRVEVQGFHPASGTTEVQPGLTQTIEAVMPTATVTYTWSVTPTSITDQYGVSLQAQFKTDVPAPVVVLGPAMEKIQAPVGSVTYGQVTVTNRGIVAAENVELHADSPDGAVKVEFAITQIPVLGPGQTISVPYKMTLLHSSPCHPVIFGAKFCYKCAMGMLVNGQCNPLQILIGDGSECAGGALSVQLIPPGGGWAVGVLTVVGLAIVARYAATTWTEITCPWNCSEGAGQDGATCRYKCKNPKGESGGYVCISCTQDPPAKKTNAWVTENKKNCSQTP
jgi:uncharacterized membrane protein/fibronectin type 3 domain-containing protein